MAASKKAPDQPADRPAIRFKGFSEEWEEKKLGELADLSSSKRIHVTDYVLEGIPFYRGSEVSTGGAAKDGELYIHEELYNKIRQKYGVPEEGDLLITAVGTLGNIWKVDDRRFYYKDGNLIRLSNLKLNNDYLVAYLSDGQGKKNILDSAIGSSQKALTMVKLSEIEIVAPSFTEQQQIGLFFQNLDNLITLQQNKYDKTLNIKKAMLEKMFPKEGGTKPEIRFKGFSGEWEKKKFNEVLVINAGKDYKHLSDGSIPVYGTGGYMLSVNEALSNVDGVGIGRKGTIDKPQYLHAPYWTVDTLFFLTALDNYDIQFLYTLSQIINWKLFDESTGLPSLSKSTINEIIRFFPSYKEQVIIGSFFQQLDKLINSYRQKLDKLKNIKKALLEKMFV